MVCVHFKDKDKCIKDYDYYYVSLLFNSQEKLFNLNEEIVKKICEDWKEQKMGI